MTMRNAAAYAPIFAIIVWIFPTPVKAGNGDGDSGFAPSVEDDAKAGSTLTVDDRAGVVESLIPFTDNAADVIDQIREVVKSGPNAYMKKVIALGKSEINEPVAVPSEVILDHVVDKFAGAIDDSVNLSAIIDTNNPGIVNSDDAKTKALAKFYAGKLKNAINGIVEYATTVRPAY